MSEAGRAPPWPKSHLIDLTNVRPPCYSCINNDERTKMDEDFDFFIDHEAGFDCDPYDVESYHAEAVLAYSD